jgi:ABC-2 type transport system permease protein
MQLAESRRQPKHLLILLTNPLFAAIFLSITMNAGNPVAINAAVFAPALISMWFLSLDIGGSMISLERWQGTLDLLIASPARLGVVMFGRVCSVSLLVAATFAESYLVARFGFAVPVRLWHAGLLLVTILITMLAMSGTATLLADCSSCRVRW